jgi:hypothetical protein
MGSAPYLGGGFGHFYAYAPFKFEYAIDRFAMEVKRQLDVLDRNLGERTYMAGDAYTIADMAIWPWYGALVKGLIYDAGAFLAVHEYKNVIRWTDLIAERPAVKRGRMVNRVMGDPASQLHERHDAGDFDTKIQEKIILTCFLVLLWYKQKQDMCLPMFMLNLKSVLIALRKLVQKQITHKHNQLQKYQSHHKTKRLLL